jgi:hypothetical protein
MRAMLRWLCTHFPQMDERRVLFESHMDMNGEEWRGHIIPLSSVAEA